MVARASAVALTATFCAVCSSLPVLAQSEESRLADVEEVCSQAVGGRNDYVSAMDSFGWTSIAASQIDEDTYDDMLATITLAMIGKTYDASPELLNQYRPMAVQMLEGLVGLAGTYTAVFRPPPPATHSPLLIVVNDRDSSRVQVNCIQMAKSEAEATWLQSLVEADRVQDDSFKFEASDVNVHRVNVKPIDGNYDLNYSPTVALISSERAAPALDAPLTYDLLFEASITYRR